MTRRFSVYLGMFLAFWLSVVGSADLPAQTVDPRDASRIRAVIEKQLDALRRDDWAEAYGYAAPSIQRKFGSPDGFRRMVLGGYGIVHRPRSVSFKDLSESNGRVAQSVLMVGPEGREALVLYFMAKQDDGTWRIAGVLLQRVADRAV